MRYTFVAPAEFTIEADSKESAIDEFCWMCGEEYYDSERIHVPEPSRFLLIHVGEAHVSEEINNP